MKDLIDELTEVTREVGEATLPAGEAKVVRLARTYRTDPADLWEAITDPERIARWFLPVHGDLRLGGTYQLEGNAGGEIRACDPPTHLRLTWIFGEDTSPADASLVDVHLSPDGDGTRLDLVHTAVVPPEMWDPYGPGAVGAGWDGALLGLAAHVDGVTMPSPEELERDPAMRAFYLASSVAWGAAARAAGIDAAVVDTWVAAVGTFYAPASDDD